MITQSDLDLKVPEAFEIGKTHSGYLEFCNTIYSTKPLGLMHGNDCRRIWESAAYTDSLPLICNGFYMLA